MKKFILITILFASVSATLSAQHKIELTQNATIETTSHIINSSKKSFRLFKKHNTAFHNAVTNDLPSRIQSILASDIRESSETLVSGVANVKTPKNK
jgi:hypothetical protein